MPAAISCIIPVFNGEAFLGEALASVFAQTLLPAEVIVVDDGSTDGTRDVVDRFGERIRYVYQDNKGPAAARNKGIALATGSLLAFLDADDLWLPQKLARQVRRFAERGDLQVSVTQVRNFWIEELRAEANAMLDHRLAAVALPGYVPQTMLARREVFARVGPFDERLRIGEDTDWFLRATDLGIVMELIPEVLVRRRLHHTNLTRSGGELRSNLTDAVWRSLQRRRAEATSEAAGG